jgi:hypothetical protein
VDARDPLTYFSQDLVSYAHELHATKASFVLLNKADLLPAAVRAAWAEHFEARGVPYGFWSAYAASEAQARARHDAAALGLEGASAADVAAHFRQLLGLPSGSSAAGKGAGAAAAAAAAVGARAGSGGGSGGSSSSSSSGGRTRVLSVDELLAVLEAQARAAVEAAPADDPRRWSRV